MSGVGRHMGAIIRRMGAERDTIRRHLERGRAHPSLTLFVFEDMMEPDSGRDA
jgi:hypothetical protein